MEIPKEDFFFIFLVKKSNYKIWKAYEYTILELMSGGTCSEVSFSIEPPFFLQNK